jgi:hypothetical protein
VKNTHQPHANRPRQVGVEQQHNALQGSTREGSLLVARNQAFE